MIQWLRQVRQELPKSYCDFFVFCTLTGLRASEAKAAVRLINMSGVHPSYYNSERQCLEHFRYPEIFLRRTKASYISLVDEELLGIAKNIGKTPHMRA